MTDIINGPTIRLAGTHDALDYTNWDIEQAVDPLWSDGALDGSFVPKIVGYVTLPLLGKIYLRDGRVIHFSNVIRCVDGSFIIGQPYRIV